MNIIDFASAKKDKETRDNLRNEVKTLLSNPMKALYMQMIKQALREANDTLLNVFENIPTDMGLSHEELLELYKFHREITYDTVLAMDYVIESIEGEDD